MDSGINLLLGPRPIRQWNVILGRRVGSFRIGPFYQRGMAEEAAANAAHRENIGDIEIREITAVCSSCGDHWNACMGNCEPRGTDD